MVGLMDKKELECAIGIGSSCGS